MTEQADGSLQGHYVAPVAGTARNYRTLDLVEPATDKAKAWTAWR